MQWQERNSVSKLPDHLATCYFTPKRTILNSYDAFLNYKTIHRDLFTLPTNNKWICWANDPAIWAGLHITSKKNLRTNPTGKLKQAWKILVLFLILPSPSSHTILMTLSEVVWVSQTQPSITITPICAIQGAWFRQLPLPGLQTLWGCIFCWGLWETEHTVSS